LTAKLHNIPEDMAMIDKPSAGRRWETFTATKSQVFWACATCVVGTLIVGFTWGGWVTGGTAGQRSAQAASEARAQLAATMCVDRFGKGSDVTAQLASLKTTSSWSQDRFIEDGGWVTPPGVSGPVSGAAALCVRRLLDPTPAKAAGTSG
jgi:hypothetical protein